MKIPGFRRLLEYEFDRPRPRDPNIMYDIYDSPEWQKLMGPPTQPCGRIGLQGCTDGFQAFNSGTLGLSPIEFSNFSLPPALRFRPEFMFLLALLPTNTNTSGHKKYYDFAARYELNLLFHTGRSLYYIPVFEISFPQSHTPY